MIKIKTLFHVHSPDVRWYELASIEVLSETYELTNVRKHIRRQTLPGGECTYDEILEETREKLQDYFTLPYEPWNTDVYPYGVNYQWR